MIARLPASSSYLCSRGEVVAVSIPVVIAGREEALPSAIQPLKRDAQALACVGSPRPGMLALELMHVQRRVRLIAIQEPERASDTSLIGGREREEAIQKLYGEDERLVLRHAQVGQGYAGARTGHA